MRIISAPTENGKKVLTMDEYIKKEDIEQKIQDGLNNLVLGHDAIEVLGMIYVMPAADVAPVRHGEWEIVVGSNGKEYMVCTCCRVSQDLTGVFSYCPNCGAKMDGGAD